MYEVQGLIEMLYCVCTVDYIPPTEYLHKLSSYARTTVQYIISEK